MDRIERIMLTTKDLTIPNPFGDGEAMPAMTTLLHRVCGNDEVRFAEACRIVRLFIDAALKDG